MKSYHSVMQQSVDYCTWVTKLMSDDGIEFASIKHDKANDQYVSCGPYHATVGGNKSKYTSGKGAKCTWTIYDESYNLIATSAKKECAGDPPEITFGPENWVNKEPGQYDGWGEWETILMANVYGIPSAHSSAWKEPIPLPDLPVDYAGVAKQFNEQFSYAGVKA